MSDWLQWKMITWKKEGILFFYKLLVSKKKQWTCKFILLLELLVLSLRVVSTGR